MNWHWENVIFLTDVIKTLLKGSSFQIWLGSWVVIYHTTGIEICTKIKKTKNIILSIQFLETEKKCIPLTQICMTALFPGLIQITGFFLKNKIWNIQTKVTSFHIHFDIVFNLLKFSDKFIILSTQFLCGMVISYSQ